MAVPCEVQTGQLSIRGLSLGGVETCLQVPQLDLMFDCGHCPRSLSGTSRLLLTHGHADHCGGLIGYLSNRTLTGPHKPLEIWAPEPIVEGLRRAIMAYESIQTFPYSWTLTAVSPGDEIPLRRGLVARVFRSVHVVHTVGYTVWETVKKLKSEFRELPGPEIARRKHAGEPLFNDVTRPVLSFPGDTCFKVVDQQPHLLESKVLLLETTYIDPRRSVEQCHRHGHVHLDEVIARAADFKNEHLVFTHFSQSYRPRECHEIVAERTQGLFAPEIHVFAPTEGSWPG